MIAAWVSDRRSIRTLALLLAGAAPIAIGVAVALLPFIASVAVGAIVGALIVVTLVVQVASAMRSVPRDVRLGLALFLGGLLTFGLLTARPLMSTTFSDWLFIAAAGVVVPVLIRQGHRDGPALWVWAGLTLFTVGALTASSGSLDPVGSLGTLVRLAFILSAFLWCALLVFGSWVQIRLGLIAWVFGAALTSSGVIIQRTVGDVIPGAVDYYGRLSGFADSFNGLGAIVAISLPVGVALAVHALRSGRPWLALFAVAQVLLMIVASIASGSVGSLVAGTIGMAALVASSRRGRGTVVILVGSAALVMVVSTSWIGGQTSPLERLAIVTDPMNGAEATLWTRIEGYAAAWDAISRSPVVGVGLASSDAVTSAGTSVHNLALAAWYEAGLFGFAGALILIGGYLRSILVVVHRRGLVDANSRWDDLTAGVAAAGISALVVSFQEPILFQRFFWLPLVFLLPIIAIKTRVNVSVNGQDEFEAAVAAAMVRVSVLRS